MEEKTKYKQRFKTAFVVLVHFCFVMYPIQLHDRKNEGVYKVSLKKIFKIVSVICVSKFSFGLIFFYFRKSFGFICQ